MSFTVRSNQLHLQLSARRSAILPVFQADFMPYCELRSCSPSSWTSLCLMTHCSLSRYMYCQPYLMRSHIKASTWIVSEPWIIVLWPRWQPHLWTSDSRLEPTISDTENHSFTWLSRHCNKEEIKERGNRAWSHQGVFNSTIGYVCNEAKSLQFCTQSERLCTTMSKMWAIMREYNMHSFLSKTLDYNKKDSAASIRSQSLSLGLLYIYALFPKMVVPSLTFVLPALIYKGGKHVRK